ncbi:MAG: hypothetical protein MK110_09825 [Fuerstiella sp.]|nr:hypothetical protein [Fuerstiella sp.]
MFSNRRLPVWAMRRKGRGSLPYRGVRVYYQTGGTWSKRAGAAAGISRKPAKNSQGKEVRITGAAGLFMRGFRCLS